MPSAEQIQTGNLRRTVSYEQFAAYAQDDWRLTQRVTLNLGLRYERETPQLFRAALAAAKQRLDPAGILNPGVLINPAGRKVGPTGALAM